VKICGMTDPDNMQAVARLQPGYLGFIFYADSPRDVTEKIGTLNIKSLPAAIKRVAVLVNEELEQAKAMVRRYGFDAVQLHGEETPAYCRSMQECAMVIKALPVANELPDDLHSFKGCCDMLLFENASAQRGGSGLKFDHSLLLSYDAGIPFLLGGGIGPGDAPAMRKLAGKNKWFAGVDLNSRFEAAAGIKDVNLLSDFIKDLNRNFHNNCFDTHGYEHKR